MESVFYYVDASGPNDPGTGTFEYPFRRIQDAIDQSDDDYVIEIRPGVYSGVGNYNLDPDGKSLTFRSVNQDNQYTIAETVIDPNKAGRGFYFHSGEDANCVVSGLTIRNAYVNGDGGAIGCLDASPTIKNCVIFRNESRYGGAIAALEGSSPTLTNCTIVRNFALFNGGGVYCWDSNTTIKNCIIWQNSVLPEADGNQVGLEYQSSASISYTDIQDGQNGTSVGGSTLFWLSGNIDSDPCFTSFDSDEDPNMWDFHLQSSYGRWDSGFHRIDFNGDGIINLSDFAGFAGLWLEEGDNIPGDLNRDSKVDSNDLQIFSGYYLTAGYGVGWAFDTATSPCIDAGDPNSDWNIEPWPNGKRINMGAYGETSQASKNGNRADFNIDGVVNFVDFAVFSSKWLEQTNSIENLNGDNTVGLADLYIFSENWLWQK